MEDYQGNLPARSPNTITFCLLSGRPLLPLLVRHSHVSLPASQDRACDKSKPSSAILFLSGLQTDATYMLPAAREIHFRSRTRVTHFDSSSAMRADCHWITKGMLSW